jgi:transcriptional regulator with XRE-family HTH domain
MARTRKQRSRAGGIGSRVRRIREAKGLRQVDVAEAAGFHSSADLCNFEMGRKSENPGARRLLALAAALSVSVEELLS